MARHALAVVPLLVLATGCSRTPAPTEPTSSAPSAIAVPDTSATELLSVQAKGAQVYACSSSASPDGGSVSYAWTLDGPDATLTDRTGAAVGTHTKGPAWTLSDGSSVVGAVVAKLASSDAGAVPWLLLKVSASHGAGALSGARFVQRLDTSGGVAPTGGCDAAHAGATARVDYTARYVFWGTRQGR